MTDTIRMPQSEDLTALSYWYPKLLAAGLPVPRTTIVKMPAGVQETIWSAFDGKEGGDNPEPFFDEIDAAAREFGYPCFLRSDHTSNKHGWRTNCFLPDRASIAQHVFNICEFSECCGLIGLPWDTWAVREMLPTMPLGVCPHYGNMPICREFRFFVEDGEIRCRHPYWPLESLEQGGANWIDGPAILFEHMRQPPHKLDALASAAGRALGGAWSIDILETTRGWFITDLAEAGKSFHWEGCEHAASFERRRA